jgi:hypothetical protein
MLLWRGMLPHSRQWVAVAMIVVSGPPTELCSALWRGRGNVAKGTSIDRRMSTGLIDDCSWC